MNPVSSLRQGLDQILQDAKFAFRSLARSPGYALVVVVTLGLAIGATSAIFSLVDGVLLRDLPYEHNDRLVVLEAKTPKRENPEVNFSVQEMVELSEGTRTLDEVVEHHSMSFILYGREEPRRVSTGVVSANFFDVLGVAPEAGRLFRPDDEGHDSDAVLVLSWDFWQRAFGGDEDIVGDVFEMNDRPHTVIGVLPPIPQWPQDHDVYMPTVACPFRAQGNELRHENRNAFRMLTVFGRLAEQQDVGAAQREIGTFASRWQNDHPETYRPEIGFAIETSRLDERLGRGAKTTLSMLLATAAMVMLIACANVANLGVARLLARRRELAVRNALGAGRQRILRQLLTESTLLALVGAALGLLLAYRGIGVLARFVARYSPRAVDVGLDGRVVLFTALVAVVAGILAGSLPLLSLSTRSRLALALRDGARSGGGRQSSRLRSLLVTAQVAASVLLLAAAGLFLDSMWRLQQVDLGYDTELVVTAQIPMNWSQFDGPEELLPHLRSLEIAAQSVPGITSVSLGSSVPLSDQRPGQQSVLREGQTADDLGTAPRIDVRIADGKYFSTLDVPVELGRVFDSRDDAESPAVVVVDRKLAGQLFPGEPAVGRRLSRDGGNTWEEIVGVVAETRQRPDEPPRPTLYVSPYQAGFGNTLFLRTQREPVSLTRDLKTAIWSVAPTQVVEEVRTFEELRRESTAAPRTVTVLVALFAGLALVITIAGVAGIVAHGVGQRRREIGVRVALGARRVEVLRLVLSQALLLVAGGLAVGLVAAVLGGRSLAPLLYDSSGVDPLVLVGVGVAMVLTALVACLLPARRALRVEPATALRSD